MRSASSRISVSTCLNLMAFWRKRSSRAAGRGHQNIDPTTQAHHLRVDTDAAVSGVSTDWQVLAILAETGLHLFSQFPRRHQHQGADRVARRLFAFAQTLQYRQRKAGRLAGTGLGGGHQIAPGEDGGNGLQLDRGGGFVAERFERLQQRSGEAEGSKGHGEISTTGKGRV
jgi:hypothetical protein